MPNNLNDFIGMIPDFNKLKQSTLMDCFAYYLVEYEKRTTFSAKEIGRCYADLKMPPYTNIPKYLLDNAAKPAAKSKKVQKFLKNGSGYSLTRACGDEVKQLVVTDAPKVEVSKSLRSLLTTLTNTSEQNYLEEAIKTFEVEAYRASIIMVWLLTIDHLYEYILADKTRITNFITALRSAGNKTNIHSKDNFGDLKESVFLHACKTSSIISHDVWKILDVKLGIRNSFAHPSTIVLNKSKAFDFIEDLIHNVVLKHKI